MTDEITDFGPRVDLTNRIAEILRSYPDNAVLKEMLQNADDATATTFRVCYDTRNHTAPSLTGTPLQGMLPFLGSSLLVYNDAVFTDADLKSIQSIGGSVKRGNVTKTGRFGIGFNSVYHVTDVPSFVSNKVLCLFDPHIQYATVNHNPGMQLSFVDAGAGKKYEEFFKMYEVFGAKKGNAFNGTLFRLPLRTEELAAQSKLCKIVYSHEFCQEILQDFQKCASECLLFLKNVRVIELYVIDGADASPRMLFSTKIVNPPKHRSFVTMQQGAEIPKLMYDIQIQESTKPTPETWMVSQGPGSGRAAEMAKDGTGQRYGLTLFPWGGVAFNTTRVVPVSDSRVYCFLPVMGTVGLPIHVNGYFELSSNRRDVWWGSDLVGEAKYRAEWNRVLLSDTIPDAYVSIIMKVQPDRVIGLLPPMLPEPWGEVSSAVYRLLKDAPIFIPLVSSKTPQQHQQRVSSSKVIFALDSTPSHVIQYVLDCGESVAIVPPYVVEGFTQALGVAAVRSVSPKLVRSLAKDIGKKKNISSTPDVFEYACSDPQCFDSSGDLMECWLLPMMDGSTALIENVNSEKVVFYSTDPVLLELAPVCLAKEFVHANVKHDLLKSIVSCRKYNIREIDPVGIVSLFQRIEIVPEKSLSLFWKYVALQQVDVSVLEGKRLFPIIQGPARSIVSLKRSFSAFSPSMFESTEIRDCLLACNIPMVDEAVFGLAAGVARYNVYYLPANIGGIVKALYDSYEATKWAPNSVSLNTSHRKHLRQYAVSNTGSKTFTPELRKAFSRLPLFPVPGQEDVFRAIDVDHHVLPPTQYVGMFPSPNFITPESPAERELLLSMGVKELSDFEYLEMMLTLNMDPKGTDAVARACVIISAYPKLMTVHGPAMKTWAFVPNSTTGALFPPSHFVDPRSTWLSQMYTEDYFPAVSLCTDQYLPTLISMGLQATMSRGDFLTWAQKVAPTNRNLGVVGLRYLNINAAEFLPKKSSGGMWAAISSLVTADKKKETEESEAFFNSLRSMRWVPVRTAEKHSTVAPFLQTKTSSELQSPNECRPESDAPLCCAVMYIVDEDISPEVRQALGWADPLPNTIVLQQLRALTTIPVEVCEKECQAITQVVMAVYGKLSPSDVRVTESKVVWIGNKFVQPQRVAFTHALGVDQSFLHVVPQTFQCFAPLLTAFGVRSKFTALDYLSVLTDLAKEKQGKPLVDTDLTTALLIARFVADNPCPNYTGEIFIPTQHSILVPAPSTMFNDAEWIAVENANARPLVHPHLSHTIAEKLGSVSRRRVLVTANTLPLGVASGDVQAFGQHESITSRIRSILDMYPEGSSILSELIQNADDAGATQVKIVYDKTMYGTAKTLASSLTPWQGPALVFYNNATFTAQDFTHLAEIGQMNKLDNVRKTGRFGLGFNSVYHFTDVPSFLTGSDVVMFDPHVRYVPGAQAGMPGIRMNIMSNLTHEFPDQFAPYTLTGWVPGTKFNGTLFRFPLRTEEVASTSDICKIVTRDTDVMKTLTLFRQICVEVLLFLKCVTEIEVTVRDETGFHQVFHLKCDLEEYQKALRSEVSDFIYGDPRQPNTREQFLKKLKSTPAGNLPISTYRTSIRIEDFNGEGTPEATEQVWLICNGLGQESSRQLALESASTNIRLVPCGGVAVCTSLPKAVPMKGRVFCFLPLPTETGLPVHVNGFFELSSNRRTIWYGDDLQGRGEAKAKWNLSLLQDVIAKSYSLLVMQTRNEEVPYRLFPSPRVAHPWDVLAKAFYETVHTIPVFWSSFRKKWVSLSSCVLPPEGAYDESLLSLLDAIDISVVCPPEDVVLGVTQWAKVKPPKVTPAYVRSHIKSPKYTTLLSNLSNTQRHELLEFVLTDLGGGNEEYQELIGLPLIPTADGKWATFNAKGSAETLVMCSTEELQLMKCAPHLVLSFPTSSKARPYFEDPRMHKKLNVAMASSKVIALQVRQLNSSASEQSVRAVWEYILSKKAPLKDFEMCALLPTRGDFFATLTTPPRVFDPRGVPEDVVDALVILGTQIFQHEFLSFPTDISTYLVQDVVEALRNVIPDLMKCGEAFGKLSPTHRRGLRQYFAMHVPEVPQSVECVRSLPIMECRKGDDVFVAANSLKHSLPPVEQVPLEFLETEILFKAETPQENALLQVMGVRRMTLAALYMEHLIPTYAQQTPELRQKILLYLMEMYDVMEYRGLQQCLEVAQIFPDNKGVSRCAGELYHPTLASLGIVTVFPIDWLCEGQGLHVLGKLGMRVVIESRDVLATLENLKSDPDGVQRSHQLIRHMSEQKDTYLLMLRDKKFENVGWIPVEVKPPSPFLPWVVRNDDVTTTPTVPALMPAGMVRPSQDMWLCSGTYGILSNTMERCDLLEELCQWNTPISPVVSAKQILCLAELVREVPEVNLAATTFKSDIDYIFNENLTYLSHARTNSGSAQQRGEVNKALELLRNQNCVWNGKQFCNTNFCAFQAPLDVAPYLIALPPHLEAHKDLLLDINVSETFVEKNYYHLLQTMSRSVLTEEDLVIVQKVLDFLSERDFATRCGADVGTIVFLPDTTLQMRPGRNVCINDVAGWSDAEAERSSAHLLHPSIPVETGLRFGARSLRAVVSELTQSTASTWRSGDTVRNLVHPWSTKVDPLDCLWDVVAIAEALSCSFLGVIFDTTKYDGIRVIHPNLSAPNQTKALVLQFGGFAARTSGTNVMEQFFTRREGTTFLKCFSISEVIYVATKEELTIVDPHQKYLPEDSEGIRSCVKSFSLSDHFQDTFPDMSAPLSRYLNTRSDNVMFVVRIPLMEDAMNDVVMFSKIVDGVVTISPCLRKVRVASVFGPTTDVHLQAELRSVEERRKFFAAVHEAQQAHKTAAEAWMKWTAPAVQSVVLPYRVVFDVCRGPASDGEGEPESRQETWNCVASIAGGKSADLLKSHGEVPYSVVMARREPVLGHLFGLKSPPTPLGVPVHWYCNKFSVASSQSPEFLTRMEKWKKDSQANVAIAYTRLLVNLKEESLRDVLFTPSAFYKLWPTTVGCVDPSSVPTIHAIYKSLAAEPVYRLNGKFEKLSAGKFVQAPTGTSEDVAALAASVNVNTFSIPEDVAGCAIQSSASDALFDAKCLRDTLRASTTQKSFGSVQQTIKALEFAVSDGQVEQLKSVPLLPLCGTPLPVKFGSQETWIGTPDEIKLLPMQRTRFVDPAVLESATLAPLFASSNATAMRSLNVKPFSAEILAEHVKTVAPKEALNTPYTTLSIPLEWLDTFWKCIPIDKRRLFDNWALVPTTEGGMASMRVRECIPMANEFPSEIVAVLRTARVPLLHEAFPHVRSAETPITAQARLFEFIRALNSLGYRINWEGLTEEECDELTTFVGQVVHQLGESNPLDVETIRGLPIYRYHNTPKRMAIFRDTLTYDETHPFFQPTDKYLDLRGQSTQPDLYRHVGVNHCAADDIWLNEVLPRFPEFSSEERLERYECLRNSPSIMTVIFEHTVAEKLQIPDRNGVLRLPRDMYDPRNEFLNDVLDSRESFPAPEYCHSDSLDFLVKLGMKNNVDPDVMLNCITSVHQLRSAGILSEANIEKARKVAQRFHETLPVLVQASRASSARPDTDFLAKVSKLYFIPLVNPQRGDIELFRHQDCCLASDVHLAGNVLPVLPKEFVIPQGTVRQALKIDSPPLLTNVIRHAQFLTERVDASFAEVPDCMSDGLLLMQYIYDHRAELKSDDIRNLRTSPLVCVGPRTRQYPYLIARRAGDVFHGFMNVLPLSYYPYVDLLSKLGTVEDVTPEFLSVIQKDALSRYVMKALTVTELASCVRLIQTVADQGVKVYAVPDQHCMLCPSEHVVVNDAPWIMERMVFSNLFLAHPKITQQLAHVAGLRSLSHVVTEALDTTYNCMEVDPMQSQELTAKLQSHALASVISVMMEQQSSDHTAEVMSEAAIQRQLSQFRVVLVANLHTRLKYIPAGTTREVDVTATDRTAASSFVDAKSKVIYIASRDDKTNPFVALSVCVSSLLHCTPQLRLEEILRTHPDEVPNIARDMHIATQDVQQRILLQRGVPGFPVQPEDLAIVTLSVHDPPQVGETIAWEDITKTKRYGRVVNIQEEGVTAGNAVPALCVYFVLVGLNERKKLSVGDMWRFIPKHNLHEQQHRPPPIDERSTAGNPTPQVPVDTTMDRETREALVETVSSLLQRIDVPFSMDQRELLTKVTQLTRELSASKDKVRTLEARTAQQKAEIQNLEICVRCPICLEGKMSVAFVPCGHCACEECFSKLPYRKCHNCRSQIDNVVKIFM